jgi:hypothetical protein
LFLDISDFHLPRHWNGYLRHTFEAWWSFLGSNHGLHLSHRRRPLHDGKFDLSVFITGTTCAFGFGLWLGFSVVFGFCLCNVPVTLPQPFPIFCHHSTWTGSLLIISGVHEASRAGDSVPLLLLYCSVIESP